MPTYVSMCLCGKNVIMKKLLPTLLFFLFTSSIIQAQNFGGGLIGGATFSQLLGTEIYGFQKAGIVVGVYADRIIKNKSGIQIEMVFVQKGSRKVTKDPISAGGAIHVINRNLNYIEVPLLFETKLKGRFSFEVGLSGAVLISTKFRNENGEAPDGNPQLFNRFELGGLGGFNFRISDKFDLNLRYLNSILRVRKHQFEQSWRLNNGEYNSVLQVSLRYKFNKKTQE